MEKILLKNFRWFIDVRTATITPVYHRFKCSIYPEDSLDILKIRYSENKSKLKEIEDNTVKEYFFEVKDGKGLHVEKKSNSFDNLCDLWEQIADQLFWACTNLKSVSFDKNGIEETEKEGVKMFKIFEIRNLAETSKDKDDIRFTEIAFADSIESAIDIANKHIKDKSYSGELKEVNSDIRLADGNILKNVKYKANDSGSWAPTLIIQEIK